MATVAEVVRALDEIAPPHLALGDDPRGLLIGDAAAPVHRVVVALDVTLPVVLAAARSGASLIVAHHPLIYHPLKTLRAGDGHPGAVVLACVQAGIAVACAHTNWDVAPGGINDVLADLLGLTQVRPLQITWRGEPLVKIVVFVPTENRETVLNAMAQAGAGAIGNYDRCAFFTPGTGTFRPLPGAAPNRGTINEPEIVREDRLEMIAPASRAAQIVHAMKTAHPYEAVAHDVIPLANTGAAEYGIGRIGALPRPQTAAVFLSRIKEALHFREVRLVGARENQWISTVAVCGGAGASLMPDALRAGADALVTSDVRHHEFVDAGAQNFVLVDAGHAATETPGARALADRLREALPGVDVEFIVA